MVENGSVQKIIFPEDNLSIKLEEHSGQAFIYAVGQLLNPITLAVVTKSGLVQDIEIEFKDLPAEVIILKEPSTEETIEPVETDFPCNTNQPALSKYDRIQLIINDIFAGSVPEGYRVFPLERKVEKIKWGIESTPLIKLEGVEDIIYIYEISNVTKKRRSLSESEIKDKNSLWICLESHQIRPKEKILGIVCIGRS